VSGNGGNDQTAGGAGTGGAGSGGGGWMRDIEDATHQLEKRNRLQELAIFIGSARSVAELLPEAQRRVVDLFDAERSTVYAVDTKNNHLVSLAKTGGEFKEIRVARQPTSVAGFVGVSKRSVSVRDVYDGAELGRLHPQLKFDRRWDEASGFRTKSMMTAAVLYEGNLLGVLQVINRKDGSPFTPRDVAKAEEIGRALGLAFYNLNRVKTLKEAKRTGKWDRLTDGGAISHDELQKALQVAAAASVDPARHLIEKVGVNRDDVERSLSLFYNCEVHRFTGHEAIPDDLKAKTRVDFLRQICAAPIEKRGSTLIVVIDDPSDISRTDALRALDPERDVVLRVGIRDEILGCIEKSFGLRGDVGLILKELSADQSTGAVEDAADEEKVADSDSAVIKLANQIIIDAFRRGASDIHVEPNGKERTTIIRFRVDGDCVAYQEIPPAFRHPLVARLKIMANLDISERRKPQDGKIRFKLQDRQIELRVATLPTVNGNEDVVMRILAASKPIPLDEMGMSDRNLRELKAIIAKPYGLVLCVGPTGSGKTTTLHSALGHINTVDMKIWTAEDPVEITQAGLRQVQVQPKIGFTFAQAMRAFLRADPDVIMVGEMRDKETAGTGIEASLTGHLVLSTLHTNSAPETITRLIDMDLDPFSFADALLGVLAQRLARGLCRKCREAYAAGDDELASVVNAFGEAEAARRGWLTGPLKLWRGRGCEGCGGSGYKGRLGLHELLITTEDLKHAIARKAPVEEIRELAVAGGMTTLLQDGIEKAVAGKTDLTQVLAVCMR